MRLAMPWPWCILRIGTACAYVPSGYLLTQGKYCSHFSRWLGAKWGSFYCGWPASRLPLWVILRHHGGSGLLVRWWVGCIQYWSLSLDLIVLYRTPWCVLAFVSYRGRCALTLANLFQCGRWSIGCHCWGLWYCAVGAHATSWCAGIATFWGRRPQIQQFLWCIHHRCWPLIHPILKYIQLWRNCSRLGMIGWI